ncbi:hypothetical protein CJ030_MR4G001400 [Morella rubra]|uniref:Stigma-specific STIG1-like protein 4 n=1 Tax=Morella rubra TaxID=262757 RepID=A0A6A1VSY5_9ROSI|nr:hypothetical protein CJ030_MR4G001400 [Morella rubra]
MQHVDVKIACLLLLSLIQYVMGEGNATPEVLVQQNITGGSSSSPWLKKTMNDKWDPRDPGCWKRPWICSQGEFPPTRRCCRNRCIDVTSDNNNCGLCGLICPFTWQCCRGFCIDTNISPFNCGKCGHRCPFRVLCFYGMCGYAQPSPPRPFPLPPPWPRPPFPFPPKRQPPKPPHPPHPPKGWQPPAAAMP